jgi:RNA polymerase sigma-70 factor, ECF subfamily
MRPDAIFDQERAYLFAIAYRMLGSAADADDMVQEAWLRWRDADHNHVEKPRAYLAGVVSRLSIDRLRELKRRREEYIGPWVPEPLLESAPPDGGEMAESLSLAFLTLLERLTPLERAVFLLRQVFCYEYPEIASILGKSEANCRQQFSRARKHIASDRPRFETSPDAQKKMLDDFLDAARSGDLSRMESVLKEEVELVSDGGGKVAAAMRVLKGRKPVARLLHGLATRMPEGAALDIEVVNGQLGMLMRVHGKIDTVWVIESIKGEAAVIRMLRNPDKLARLG